MPAGIALADDFGPSEFIATGAQTALRAVVLNGGSGTGIFASGKTAVDASGGTVGLNATGTTAVRARSISGTAVDADSTNGTALKANSDKGTAIDATAHGNATAISAHISGSAGASVAIDAGHGAETGVKAFGFGTAVDATGGKVAVKAASPNGVGVEASGKGSGVKAISYEGIAVVASGAIRGVQAYADQAGSEGLFAFGDRAGVYAEGKLGADLGGTHAPLRLRPAATTGRPQSAGGVVHEVGELYVDNLGQLFLCTGKGTPGTWVKVAVTPAP